MRDLEKDLDICNAATRGPWKRNEKPSFGDWWVYVGGQHICLLPADKKGTHFGEMFKANAEFIAAAREGWPHAIGRALKAEAALQAKLDNAIDTAFDLDAQNARLRKVIRDLLEVVEMLHPNMNPDEPCVVYEAWVQGKQALAEHDKTNISSEGE